MIPGGGLRGIGPGPLMCGGGRNPGGGGRWGGGGPRPRKPGWPRGGNIPAGPGPRNPNGGGLIPGGGGRGPLIPKGIGMGPGILMNGGRPLIRGKNLGYLGPPLKSPRPL